ncbi:O-antigen ligase family protein, partial [Candidatus Latescibacterota bacterium]
NLILIISIFLVCLIISFVLTSMNMTMVAGAVIGIGLFIFGFISPKISLYLLIFSMLLSPELGARDYTGKGFTIRFEDLLLVIMCFTWFAKSAVNKEIGLAVRTPLNFPIFFYMLICFVATLLGIMDGNVTSPLTGILFVVKYFEYFVIYFLIVNHLQSKQEIRHLLTAIMITYLIVLVVSLAQIPQGGRITAPFEGQDGEPNTLGGYLIMMFSLNAVLFFSVEKTYQRVFLAICAFLNFLALLHTLSRIGFFVIYIALIFFIKKRNFLIFGMAVGMMVAPMVLPEIVVERIMYTFGIAGEDVTARHEQLDKRMEQYMALSQAQKEMVLQQTGLDVNVDSSTAMRLKMMENVMRDFPKRPILGYGVTGYEFLDAQLLKVLIETGILGVFTFCYLMFATGKLLFVNWYKYKSDPLYNTLTVGTLCTFLGFLAHSLGTNTFIIVRLMEPFWCLVGMCMAIPIIEKKAELAALNTPQFIPDV